jgi:hypothetical protein
VAAWRRLDGGDSVARRRGQGDAGRRRMASGSGTALTGPFGPDMGPFGPNLGWGRRELSFFYLLCSRR